MYYKRCKTTIKEVLQLCAIAERKIKAQTIAKRTRTATKRKLSQTVQNAKVVLQKKSL